MIEGTLTLKRFADNAVSRLFGTGTITEEDVDADEEVKAQTEKVDKAHTLAEGRRRMELEDAIRKGFKAGLGSRQNAPAEWIGKPVQPVGGIVLIW
jgi:cullin-4